MNIALHEPTIDAAEAAAVQTCLASGWVSSAGPQVRAFEEAVAAYCGVPHAIATSSGTAALHLALLAAGVQPGDLVLMPALSFVAPVHAVRYVGAVPVFVDMEAVHWQMDPDLLEAWLAAEVAPGGRIHRSSGRRIGALLPVHVLGYMGDMARLQGLAAQYGIPLVEDAAEALGSHAGGRHAGTFGLLGCLSFNGNKIITTGGGGMVLTQDPALAAQVRHLSTQARLPGRGYVHDQVGYNYRLPALGAALGLAQMQRLEDHLARKAVIEARYREALPMAVFPAVCPGTQPNHWLCTALLAVRDPAIEALAAGGIEARPLWTPLDQLGPYRDSRSVGRGEVAGQLFGSAVSLPSSPGLTEAQQDRVIAVVRAACGYKSG
ncbi:MAG: LegC family aminotransferase [Bacteroidia bacterium]